MIQRAAPSMYVPLCSHDRLWLVYNARHACPFGTLEPPNSPYRWLHQKWLNGRLSVNLHSERKSQAGHSVHHIADNFRGGMHVLLTSTYSNDRKITNRRSLWVCLELIQNLPAPRGTLLKVSAYGIKQTTTSTRRYPERSLDPLRFGSRHMIRSSLLGDLNSSKFDYMHGITCHNMDNSILLP